MKYDWIDKFLLEKKGVRKDFKEEWNWLRYMIEDKMFTQVVDIINEIVEINNDNR